MCAKEITTKSINNNKKGETSRKTHWHDDVLLFEVVRCIHSFCHTHKKRGGAVTTELVKEKKALEKSCWLCFYFGPFSLLFIHFLLGCWQEAGLCLHQFDRRQKIFSLYILKRMALCDESIFGCSSSRQWINNKAIPCFNCLPQHCFISLVAIIGNNWREIAFLIFPLSTLPKRRPLVFIGQKLHINPSTQPNLFWSSVADCIYTIQDLSI